MLPKVKYRNTMLRNVLGHRFVLDFSEIVCGLMGNEGSKGDMYIYIYVSGFEKKGHFVLYVNIAMG